MTKGDWSPASFRRLLFQLSDQKPVLGCHFRHPKGLLLRDMHYEVELGIVCSGRIERRYENYRRRLGPGELWLTGIWEPHEAVVLEAPCEVVVLVILPPMLATLRMPGVESHWLTPFTAEPRARPWVPGRKRKEMRALAQRLKRCIEGHNPQRDAWLQVLLMETLLSTRDFWNAPVEAQAAGTTSQALVNRAVQLVFDQRRLVPAPEAAAACGMSRSRFDHVFPRAMGISFATFGLRYRLSGVAGDLLKTDEPVKAVATAWGFTDASHLHRLFARHYGCTPQEYRTRFGM